MSPGNALAGVAGLVVALSAFSVALTGSSAWGVGLFVAVLITFFVSNRTTERFGHLPRTDIARSKSSADEPQTMTW